MKPQAWLDCRVLVTVGTGGVGKTTAAAAIGLEAARRGKRTLVLTIDPARRLADALGTGPLDHSEREVPREVLREIGVPDGGALFAMMLDTKRTFDELVERISPDAEARERIFANPIYQNLSDALAGSREYSAMEKLYELYTDARYDLIVVDTPPATHALEFLDAPRRLTGFLDSAFLRVLLHPAAAVGRTGFRLFRSSSELVLRGLERVTGLEFLSTISEFLLAFDSLIEGFGERARAIEKLLREPLCGFVLVLGPDPPQVRRGREFWKRLAGEGIHLVGAIANRVRVWPGDGPAPVSDDAARRVSEDWLASELARLRPGLDAREQAGRLVETAAAQAALASRDARSIAQAEEALGLTPQELRRVPLLDRDVHALDSLARMARHVFGKSGV